VPFTYAAVLCDACHAVGVSRVGYPSCPVPTVGDCEDCDGGRTCGNCARALAGMECRGCGLGPDDGRALTLGYCEDCRASHQARGWRHAAMPPYRAVALAHVGETVRRHEALHRLMDGYDAARAHARRTLTDLFS
jgi:hypothetical protein